MYKVLITGAAGFIGSHLCRKFIDEGFEVYGLDNLITGCIGNITGFDPSYFKFIEGDVTKNLDIDIDFDFILHFACPASPKYFLKYPIETLKVNSLGTFNTLELAERCNARYVFASTSEIYGDPLVHPQNENYWGNVNPTGIRSVYNEAKRFSESLIMAYARKDLDVRIARIFNTYGPKMKHDDGRVIPTFIWLALQSKPLTVYGDGSQTRSFCYIDDLVDGVFKLSFTEGLNGKILNLGNPEEYTILDLASIIIEKTVSTSKIVFKPLPEDDPKRRQPDITEAENNLKWRPLTPLDSGLDETIKFFMSKLLR